MNEKVKTAATKRVLSTVALATLWLAGAAGGFAALAAVPAKPPETPVTLTLAQYLVFDEPVL